MKLSKRQFINYMVDCIGYSEDDAIQEYAIYGLIALDDKQLKECIEFNK